MAALSNRGAPRQHGIAMGVSMHGSRQHDGNAVRGRERCAGQSLHQHDVRLGLPRPRVQLLNRSLAVRAVVRVGVRGSKVIIKATSPQSTDG